MIIDSQSEKYLKSLRPKVQPIFLAFYKKANELAEKSGHTVRFLDGTRTEREQEDLYASGRTKPGLVLTRSAPGLSAHNYGIAVDAGVFLKGTRVADRLPIVQSIWQTMAQEFPQLAWGGAGLSQEESDHWQLRLTTPITQVMSEFRKKGWEYIDSLLLGEWAVENTVLVYQSIGSNDPQLTEVLAIDFENHVWIELDSWAMHFGGQVVDGSLYPYNGDDRKVTFERTFTGTNRELQMISFDALNTLLQLTHTYDDVKHELSIAL